MKTKKMLLILLSLALMVAFVGCANKTETPQASESKIKDDTYKGIGTGKGGDLEVELTITNDSITAIKPLSHNETPGFDKAMETLTEAIIASNSLDVDTVSGCTMTSNGFL